MYRGRGEEENKRRKGRRGMKEREREQRATEERG
jgi:hypothetical protein